VRRPRRRGITENKFKQALVSRAAHTFSTRQRRERVRMTDEVQQAVSPRSEQAAPFDISPPDIQS
jgi:D-aminopeptidase